MRSLFLGDAEILPHRARPSVPLHGVWLAPMLCFTAEEAWLARDPAAQSVHLEPFPGSSRHRWRDDALAEKWRNCAICGASSPARSNSSARRSASVPRLKRAVIYVGDADCLPRSSTPISPNCALPRARRWLKATGRLRRSASTMCAAVAVEPRRAEGRKCARSWKISPAVGDDPQFPDVTPRDAQALREWERRMRKAAE